MVTRYVEPHSARFIEERVEGIEQLRIPMRRNWFVLLFVGFWIVMWTFGGIVAIVQVIQHFELFLIVWLAMWALGWCFAAVTIATQIAGSEIIRVVGRDLEISVGAGKLRRRRLYRGDQVRNLRSSDPNPWGMPWRMPAIRAQPKTKKDCKRILTSIWHGWHSRRDDPRHRARGC